MTDSSKRQYQKKLYQVMCSLAPIIGLSAALIVTALKLAGQFPNSDPVAVAAFDAFCALGLAVGAYFSRRGFDGNGELKKEYYIGGKIALSVMVVIQWNLLSYLFPFKDFWGYAPMFAILPAFFFDWRIVNVCSCGLAASIAVSWIVKGQLLLPVKDAEYIENFVLRIVALIISFLCISLLTRYAQKFTNLSEDTERELKSKNDKLSKEAEDVLTFAADMVSLRDRESGDHIRRVGKYAKIIAEQYMEMFPECGLTEEDCRLIANASVLHDVGKIKIPDAVLLKPGKLEESEKEILRSHTETGADVVELLPESVEERYRKYCHEICLFHHERADGAGYPYGLREADIPLSAQIAAAADVYDAMMSKRTYKEAYSQEETLKIIKQGGCGGAFPKNIIRVLDAAKEKLAD